MIVCHCAVVSDRDVEAVISTGARSVSELCRATGAGRNCGGCIFSLRQLLCQHEETVNASQPEVAGAAS